MALKVMVYSFSKGGSIVADKICDIELKSFRGEKITFTKAENNVITNESFHEYKAHIFVGALGIAVRKIAPFIDSKLSDPAVIVVDEKAEHIISVLSGHLGGANSLSKILAEYLNANCVITTATDVNGFNAIDKIASEYRLKIQDKESIKIANAKMLRGEVVNLFVDENIDTISDKFSVYKLTSREAADVVVNIGKQYIVGIGCRKDIDVDLFSKTLDDTLKEYNICYEDIDRIASIDLKKEEAAILKYVEKRNLDYETYSVEELDEICGEFDESEFVKSVTGVSNVSERACVYAASLINNKSNNLGDFVLKRKAENGITISIFKLKKMIDLTGKNNG